jgi:hypothetical protein
MNLIQFTYSDNLFLVVPSRDRHLMQFKPRVQLCKHEKKNKTATDNCIPSHFDRKNPIHFHQNTYLLTPYSTVLLEKLTGLRLVKKFPTFYETRRFITAFTSARHVSLS